jgi:hypothetical protein
MVVLMGERWTPRRQGDAGELPAINWLIEAGAHVSLCTRGGNQSWNRIVKTLDASRCDSVFVHLVVGRRWFIPAAEPERAGFVTAPDARLTRPLAGFQSGQMDPAVNRMALPSQVRILPPPFARIARFPTPSEGGCGPRSVGR